MPSEKLKKYLAYYQKTLRDDPENIEARLRLAALFREMGNIAHAIEEYVTASKLLAAQGLPLEAIAACKAVLELDPTHTEVQLFLARLFAQAPDAAGAGARIAKPVAAAPAAARRVLTPLPTPAIRPAQKIEQLSTDEMAAFERSGAEAITLAQPKDPAEHADASAELGVGDEDSEEDIPTGVHHAVEPSAAMNTTEAATVSAKPPIAESTRAYQTLDPQALDASMMSPDDTVMIPVDEHTNVTSVPVSSAAARTLAAANASTQQHAEVTFAAAPEEIARLRSQVTDEMRETVEFSYIDELRKTQAVDPDQIQMSLDEESQPPALPASLLAMAERRETLPITDAINRRDGMMTGRWHPTDRNLEMELKKELEQGLSNSTEPISDETTLEQDKTRAAHKEETFDLKVFDMENFNLEDPSLDSLLDELSDGVRDRLDQLDSEPFVGEDAARSVRINREDLPDIPLFSNVNHRAFMRFLESVESRVFEAGELIVEQGHEGRNIYIIARGKTQASKHIDGQELFLGEFSEGDFFGEFEMLTGRPSAAQVVASTQTTVLFISEETIHQVAEEDPEIWDTLWDVYHIRMLNNLMASNTIFRHLPSSVRDDVLDLFDIEEHVANDVVLAADEPCRFVCLVLFGQLNLEPTDPKLPSKILREGEFFGFVASLSDDACRANITASQDTTLLCLSATHFRQLTRQHAGIAREIRAMLRSRVTRNDLFLTGITRYADTGLEN